jgi:hypothetical protein
MDNKSNAFHYTNKEMVKELLSITPILYTDSILDAGSGHNKVWYNTVNVVEKYECELDDGNDFFAWNKKVDWVIGNPPFDNGWLFLDKASTIADKGIGFLGNLSFLNSTTPRRLQILSDKGFECNKIHIVSDARWFGRYYYMIFQRGVKSILSWNSKTYKEIL